VVKVQIAEKLSSGAKAHLLFSASCGTTKVVPFQNIEQFNIFSGAKAPDLFLAGVRSLKTPAPSGYVVRDGKLLPVGWRPEIYVFPPISQTTCGGASVWKDVR
jgi:hypothetical protein